MTPPPIRYPLPTLILTAALGLLAWRGAELSRPLRTALAARWGRAVAGPEVPKSDRPRVVAGAIMRRALMLRDGVPASDKPGGPTVETIRVRIFADIFDVWPLAGTPTHLRVGNRRPIGWIASADALAWDTRLVIRAPSGTLRLAEEPGGPFGAPAMVGEGALPVLAGRPGTVRVAVWGRDRPWSDVARIGWTSTKGLPAEDWGVWMARDELLILLRREMAGEEASVLRLRALLGRLGGGDAWSPGEIEASRRALPEEALANPGGSAAEKAEALARINEGWVPEASWAGLSFRFVPLSALP